MSEVTRTQSRKKIIIKALIPLHLYRYGISIIGSASAHEKGRIPLYSTFIILLWVKIIFFCLLNHILTPFIGTCSLVYGDPWTSTQVWTDFKLVQLLIPCTLTMCAIIMFKRPHFVSIECWSFCFWSKHTLCRGTAVGLLLVWGRGKSQRGIEERIMKCLQMTLFVKYAICGMDLGKID